MAISVFLNMLAYKHNCVISERNTKENFLKKRHEKLSSILTTSSKFVNVDKCYASEFQFGT